MGCYLKFKTDEEKEEWLDENGTLYGRVDFDLRAPMYNTVATEDTTPVVLVDNGNFYAAAVLFDKEEYDRFIYAINDERPKTLYVVDTDKLKDVVDNPMYLE